MATTPTTSELNATIIAQLEASLNQAIPLLPKSFLRVLAKVLAGVNIILYKYAGFMFLQIFVDTATIDETEINGVIVSPLVAWGRLIGVGDPTKATNAEMTVEVTVTNQTGTLPSGSQLLGATNGITYLTTAPVLLNAATVSVAVIAAGDQAGGNGSGTIGNLQIGDALSFANPLPNIDSGAVVTAVITTAADAEDTEVYRQRVKDRFQKRPQGGAYADYEIWAEEVEGIVNAYPYTSACPGQVDVYVEATEASSGSADGIPTDAQLQAVLDSIELNSVGLATRRPANALANTFPITRTEFVAVVNNLIVDDQPQTQTDITQGVSEYMLDREPFIAGLSVPPRRDRISNSGVSGLVEDIVSAANGVFSSVDLFRKFLDVSTSVYSSDSFSVNAQEANPRGFVWSTDGLKFFIVGDASIVFEYTVGTAFDISDSPIYSGNSFSVASEDNLGREVRFNSSGTRMFILGAQNGRVYQYSLTTGFDLSTVAAYAGVNFSITAQESAPYGLEFGSDGKKFFVTGATGSVFEYTVSSAFALNSTVAYTGNSVSVSSEDTAPRALVFTDRGRFLYVLGDQNNSVYEYELSVPYAFGTTVAYTTINFVFTSQDGTPAGLQFSSDKAALQMLGFANDTIFDYDIGVGEQAVDIYALGEGEKAKSGGVTYP